MSEDEKIEYPDYDPAHPDVYPLKKDGDESMLLHCGNHQNANEDPKVMAEIQLLRANFKLKLVSTGICPTCFGEEMCKLDLQEAKAVLEVLNVVEKEKERLKKCLEEGKLTKEIYDIQIETLERSKWARIMNAPF